MRVDHVDESGGHRSVERRLTVPQRGSIRRVSMGSEETSGVMEAVSTAPGSSRRRGQAVGEKSARVGAESRA
jgi:hypothetical protein